MRWIARHRALTIIAAILVALVILFAVSVNMQGDDTVVGRAARSLVTLVQKPVISLMDRINGTDAGTDEIGRLNSEIEQLKRDLQLAQLSAEEYQALKALSDGFNIKDAVADKKPVAADVITYNNTDTFNIFTINAGTDSGIDRDTVILCGDGLVGRVISADKGWARVVSITDENNKIGFQVTEQQDGADVKFLGVCAGDGEGNLVGTLLDENGFAKVGDDVVTSGLGGIYPAGITLGKITKAEYTKKSQLMEITIEPAVYFKGLTKVVALV